MSFEKELNVHTCEFCGPGVRAITVNHAVEIFWFDEYNALVVYNKWIQGCLILVFDFQHENIPTLKKNIDVFIEKNVLIMFVLEWTKQNTVRFDGFPGIYYTFNWCWKQNEKNTTFVRTTTERYCTINNF